MNLQAVFGRSDLTNCYIYFKTLSSRRGEIAHISEVWNIARNNICHVALHYLDILTGLMHK